MRKGYILGVAAAFLAVVNFYSYFSGFFTLTETISSFLIYTFIAGLLIEALSDLKKLFFRARNRKSLGKA